MLIDTRTKSRAYGRHSAFAPFFASTWLHSLPYAEVSTSQLPIEQWHSAIGDARLADAILNRLLHNSHRIKLQEESTRKAMSTIAESGHTR